MLTEVPQNPKENREKMTQIMFETFNVPKFWDGVSQFNPIYDGYSTGKIIIQKLGGRDLTEYMVKKLQEQGYSFYTSASKEIAKNIKEKACYVSLDYNDELKYVEPYDYEMPDGQHLIIKEQRINCPEILFNPEIIGIEINIYNIGETCNKAIQQCDDELRKDLYNNIYLVGGTSMFYGLPERLTNEIKGFASELMKEEVRVIADIDRKNAAWLGGAILSSISTFDIWITKDEYGESGVDIVHKKGII